jgi:hypothetical protein
MTQSRRLAIGLLVTAATITSTESPSAETADWINQLRSRIDSCWLLPSGVTNKTKIAARFIITFNPDGTLANPPALINVTIHPQTMAFVESVIAAVKRCQPYTFLPAGEYKNGWDKVDMTFSGDPESGRELREELSDSFGVRREKGN